MAVEKEYVEEDTFGISRRLQFVCTFLLIQRGVLIFFLIVLVSVRRPLDALRDFTMCQDDFELKPPDGLVKKNTFGWLGFLQYIHVTSGLPHQSKAPRVMLIHRQFVVGTAVDLLQVPKNYQLYNVVFGEYEREEIDCGLTTRELENGKTCPHAYLEMPILTITPHPEYSRFGVGNSLALGKLLRPIKSHYMMPICMPSITERLKKRRNKLVFMVDYTTNVPQDLTSERMGKRTLKLFTHRECRIHRQRSRLSSEGVTHVLCTTGCGIRHGTPIVSKNSEGGFELIGVAASSAFCEKRSQRRRLNKEPPLFIDVYPYTSWMINLITAHELPLPYSMTFRTMNNGISMGILKGKSSQLRTRGEKQKKGWRSRTFLKGNFCFLTKRKQRKAAMFYTETFEVNNNEHTRLTINMMISAGIECTIVCARLHLPNQLMEPEIEGVGGYNITVKFTTAWFPDTFQYSLGLMGVNSTETDLKAWLPERNPNFW